MQMARKLILIAIGCFAGHSAYAQTYCANSIKLDNPVKLVCLLPFATNATQQGPTSSAPDATALAKAGSFNGPIAAQLSQLPLATSAPGALTLISNGNSVPFDNLGPILLDRPDSVGKGRLVFGFSFQHFNFNHLDGIDIGSIPFVFRQQASGTTPIQYLSQDEQVSLQLNQYVALLTLGVAKNTDISVIVPFGDVSIAAKSFNKSTYSINSDNTLTPKPNAGASNLVNGSANGVGDVTVNLKQVLWRGGEPGHYALATGVAIRLPSGDARNYLGSGAYGFNLYALASYKARFSPHAKLAYQWNTSSVLLNLDNTTGGNQNLPGGAQYGLGMDVAAIRPLTISADILANEFTNSPYIQQTTTCIPASSVTPCTASSNSGTSPAALSDVSVVPTTYTTADLSFGMKYKPVRNLVVYGNVLIQMNNVGLRADPSPSFGISYSLRSPFTGKRMHKWLDR